MTYLYVRSTGSKGTLVSEMTREQSTQIIKNFKDTDYQVGILSAKDIKSLAMVYGEFAAFKEVKYSYIINVLENRIEDDILKKVKKTNLYDLAKSVLNNKASNVVKFERKVSVNEIEILAKTPYSHMSKIGIIEDVNSKGLEAKKEKVINLRKYLNTEDLSNIIDKRVACRK